MFFAQTLISTLLLVLVICYPPRFGGGNNDALTVKFLNPTESDVALCWLSTYDRENELLEKAPEGCYRIGVGVENTFSLNTYNGHRFILLPWDKQEVSSSESVALVNPKPYVPTMFLYMKPELTFYEVKFKSSLASLEDITSVDDAWQHLLRNRHYFMIFVVSVYLLSLQFLAPISARSRKASQRQQNMIAKKTTEVKVSETETNLIIPRHSLKCFAVLNMVLNHCAYMFFPDRPAYQLVGTIPADLIGSAQLFWFIVGLHPVSSRPLSVRSESSTLLIVFFLLEHFCRLPKPLTYETLFTIVVARSLLSCDMFQYKENKKCCTFSEFPIWIHGLCCCFLISINGIFNANGLRLLQCTGLLYAITGRLFLSSHPAASLSARAPHYLWLLAACGFQLKVVYVSKLSSLDIYTPQAIVVAVCLLGAVCQAALLARPVKQSWWASTRVEVWVSRYSLEIYCIHLVALWFFYGSS